MRRKTRSIAGLSLLAVLIVACSGPGVSAPEGISEGNRALDFTLESLAGDQVSLSDHDGDVVLINFWATWCAPCRAEIPDLEAAHLAYKDDGLVVLGVNVDEPQDKVEHFVDELEMSYPVLLDRQGRIMERYRSMGLPMSLIVDRDGVIRVRHTGILTGDQLETYLAEVMPGK